MKINAVVKFFPYVFGVVAGIITATLLRFCFSMEPGFWLYTIAFVIALVFWGIVTEIFGIIRDIERRRENKGKEW